MKWFRNKSSEKQISPGAYEHLIRLAVEDYRDRKYASSIVHFRDAANVQKLEEHHQILLDRAVRRWNQEQEATRTEQTAIPEEMAAASAKA